MERLPHRKAPRAHVVDGVGRPAARRAWKWARAGLNSMSRRYNQFAMPVLSPKRRSMAVPRAYPATNAVVTPSTPTRANPPAPPAPPEPGRNPRTGGDGAGVGTGRE